MVSGRLLVTHRADDKLCYLKLYSVMMKYVDGSFGWLSGCLTILSSSQHLLICLKGCLSSWEKVRMMVPFGSDGE